MIKIHSFIRGIGGIKYFVFKYVNHINRGVSQVERADIF